MNSPVSKVAAVQLNAGPSVHKNLEAVRRHIAKAADSGAVLVALPENFSIIAQPNELLAAAEDFGSGPAQDCLAECAARHRIWIIGGSVPLKASLASDDDRDTAGSDNARVDDARVYSACLVYDADGTMVQRYDKIHLFDVDVGNGERYHESAYIRAGNKVAVVDTVIGRVGLSICYDVRFPELYRALLDSGAHSVVVPAAFSATTGAVHWQLLLRARAVENQLYVIAPAQYGEHADRRTTYGHSMIVGPWGEIVATCAAGDGLIVADIDVAQQQRLRRSFPVLSHRRPLHPMLGTPPLVTSPTITPSPLSRQQRKIA